MRDWTIKDENLIVLRHEGPEGCVTKEYEAMMLYNYIKAPPQILVGFYLVFFGSASLDYSFCILLCLLGIGVVQIIFQEIGLIDLKSTNSSM